MAISTTDPRTGTVVKTFDELTDDQLEGKLAAAAAAADSYRLTSFEQRAAGCAAAADVLDKRTDEVAELMTLESGKTKKASVAEIGKCAAVLRYYADNAADFLADEPVDAEAVTPPRPTPTTCRSAWCWRSCRGTSRCGRRCGSPRRHWRRATWVCSSTRATFPKPRFSWRSCSAMRDSPTTSSRRCWWAAARSTRSSATTGSPRRR